MRWIVQREVIETIEIEDAEDADDAMTAASLSPIDQWTRSIEDQRITSVSMLGGNLKITEV